MNPPRSITAYIDAANAGDGEAAAACFSENAVVHDEGAGHHGRPAIRAWVNETTEKYRFRMVALASRESGGHIVVTCRVSGGFPGSPIELECDFTLEDGAISSLRIQ